VFFDSNKIAKQSLILKHKNATNLQKLSPTSSYDHQGGGLGDRNLCAVRLFAHSIKRHCD